MTFQLILARIETDKMFLRNISLPAPNRPIPFRRYFRRFLVAMFDFFVVVDLVGDGLNILELYAIDDCGRA